MLTLLTEPTLSPTDGRGGGELTGQLKSRRLSCQKRLASSTIFFFLKNNNQHLVKMPNESHPLI